MPYFEKYLKVRQSNHLFGTKISPANSFFSFGNLDFKRPLLLLIMFWAMLNSLQSTVVHAAPLSCEASLERLASVKDDKIVNTVELYRLLLESKILFGKAHEAALESRVLEVGRADYLQNFELLSPSQKQFEGAQIFNKIAASFSTPYDQRDPGTLTITEVGDLNYRAAGLKLKYQEFMTGSKLIQKIAADPSLSTEVAKVLTASIVSLRKIALSKEARDDRFENWKERGFGFNIRSPFTGQTMMLTTLGHFGVVAVTGIGGLLSALNPMERVDGLEIAGFGTSNVLGQASYVLGRSGVSRGTSYLRKLNAKRATKKLAAELYQKNTRANDSEE